MSNEVTNEVKHVTFELAKNALEKLAEAKPDYVAKCRYTDLDDIENGTGVATRPECIVGCILFEWGVPLRDLAAFDHQGNGSIDEIQCDLLPTLDIDRDAVELLLAAQGAQDSGDTWRDAVGMARARYDD